MMACYPTEMKMTIVKISPREWRATLDWNGYSCEAKTPWEAIVRLADSCQVDA